MRDSTEGYKDGLRAVDGNGCYQVSEGPGLGVEIDWDYIEKHRTRQRTYE